MMEQTDPQRGAAGGCVRPFWYFFALGMAAALAIFGFAVLPQPVVGPVLMGGAMVVVVVDLLARRRGVVPFTTDQSRWKSRVYLLVLGSVQVVALLFAGTVARTGHGLWLVGALACAVFAVSLAGAWVYNCAAHRR